MLIKNRKKYNYISQLSRGFVIFSSYHRVTSAMQRVYTQVSLPRGNLIEAREII